MPYIFITIQSGGWDPTEPIHLDFSPELDPEIHGFLRDQDQFLSASSSSRPSNSSSASKTQQQTPPAASSSPVVSSNNRERNNSSSSGGGGGTGAYYYLPPNSPTPPMSPSGAEASIDAARYRSSSSSSNDHPYHNAQPSPYAAAPAAVPDTKSSDAGGSRNSGSTLRMILDGLEKLGFQLVTTSSYTNNNKSYNEFILHRELTPAEIQQQQQSALLMPPARQSSSASPKHRTGNSHREEKQQRTAVPADPTIVNYGAGHVTITQPQTSGNQATRSSSQQQQQHVGIGSFAQYPAPLITPSPPNNNMSRF